MHAKKLAFSRFFISCISLITLISGVLAPMPVLASQPGCVAIFPTRVEDGVVFVDLGGACKAGEEAVA